MRGSKGDKTEVSSDSIGDSIYLGFQVYRDHGVRKGWCKRKIKWCQVWSVMVSRKNK